MGVTSKAAGAMGKQLAPRIGVLAPGLTTSFVREALHRAIVGVGPFPPAAHAAAGCDQLRSEVEGKIASAGVTRFSVTVVDANAPVTSG